MHECQEIRSANINQKEDRFLIYERDLFKHLLFFLLIIDTANCARCKTCDIKHPSQNIMCVILDLADGRTI
ncbi:4Fe-4S dicluster domain-containing protein [Acinetobacter schindleri]|uniref:4Fe-4S dicluster domain-containing protein n=4 Tax=Acinetobacter TaxID=469 RepID=UPI00097810C5